MENINGITWNIPDILSSTSNDAVAGTNACVRICYLCGEKGQLFKIHSKPAANRPFFPFLENFNKASGSSPMDIDGNAECCQLCLQNLHVQWGKYEERKVHALLRRYDIDKLTGSKLNGSCLFQYEKPPLLNLESSYGKSENHLLPSTDISTPLSLQTYGFASAQVLPKTETFWNQTPETTFKADSSNIDKRRYGRQFDRPVNKLLKRPIRSSACATRMRATLSSTNVRAPVQLNTIQLARKSVKKGLKNQDSKRFLQVKIRDQTKNRVATKPSASAMGTACHTCGEFTFIRQTYNISVEVNESSTPHFPSLKTSEFRSPTSYEGESGKRRVCAFCYHSLMHQWWKNHSIANTVNLDSVNYNLDDYQCYVCGVHTYRKRIQAISQQRFPFLRWHKPQENAITMFGGEWVIACLTCDQTLMTQWKEYERMKVPLKHRNYNWCSIPPPPPCQDDCSQSSDTKQPENLQPPVAEAKPDSDSDSDVSSKEPVDSSEDAENNEDILLETYDESESNAEGSREETSASATLDSPVKI
ncbi:hypothetical protein GQR58_019001 [Nymphon striatum]|nr:hypothetical protein GQR58_019001 [Nymphon striatum]